MSIKDRKQELSRGGMSQRLEKANPPLKEGSIKSPIKDFSMSKIEQYLSKSNLELLQKTGLPSEKRGNLGEKWLKSGPSQFGSLIQPEEIDRRISQLRNEKSFNEAAEYFYEEINSAGKERKTEYINNALNLYNKLETKYKNNKFNTRVDSLLRMRRE